MSKYNKLWIALAGTLAIGLQESGVVDTGQANAIATSLTSLLTAFGVYLVPNAPMSPKTD